MLQFGLFLVFTVCVACGSVNKTMHFFIWFVTIMGVRVCTETTVVSARVCEPTCLSVFVMLVHVYNFCLPLSFV